MRRCCFALAALTWACGGEPQPASPADEPGPAPETSAQSAGAPQAPPLAASSAAAAPEVPTAASITPRPSAAPAAPPPSPEERQVLVAEILDGKGELPSVPLRSAPGHVARVGVKVSVVRGQAALPVAARVLNRQRGRVAHCARQSARARPFEAAERLVARIAVAPDGKVASAQLRQTSQPRADLIGCVRRHLLQLRFPPPPKGQLALLEVRFEIAPR